MSVQLLRLACLAVLCIILSLGLWPFHAPRNDVRWAQDRAGLQFGRYATAISDGEFQPVSQEKQAAVSIEIWLRPRRIWDYGTFLSFQMPKGLASFAMYQSQTDLRLDANQDGRYRSSKTSLFVDDLFLKFEPAFLTVTCGPPGTSVYVNDILVKAAPQFRMDPTAVAGRMILGDAPGQSDSWKGEFLGLAIYRQELTAAQVRQHYQDWIARGRPEITPEERNVALYLFDDHAGRVVHNRAGSGLDLFLPEKYVVMDQISLEPFWHEFEMSRSYWSAAVKNIIGFMPLGFCFYAYWSAARPLKHAALATVILGTVTSVTIEVLQSFLPTRDSGTTDIITNTLGTGIGILCYRAAESVLTQLAPRFSWAPVARSRQS